MIHELTVTSVKRWGWGVLVEAEFFDLGADSGETLVRRQIEFMVRKHAQPKVGQTLSMEIDLGD